MSSRVLTGCHEVGVDTMSDCVCVCMKNRGIRIGVGCEYDMLRIHSVYFRTRKTNCSLSRLSFREIFL